MRTIASLTAFALFFAATAAFAQLSGPVGVGETTCSTYLSQKVAPPDRDSAAQWVAGFVVGNLSGAGNYIPETLTVGEVASQLSTYCAKNPKKPLVLAALTIARDYKSRQ